MPRLTIMMAARNAEETVAKAVSSTLRAAPADTELVVCDDASTDRTIEKIESLADRRVRVIRHAASQGSGAARQTVLDSTDSEFVANMDADDISLPWRFRRAIPALEGHDAVFSGAVAFGTGYPARPSLTFSLPAQEMPTILAIHNPLFHSSMLARRAAVEAVGGYQRLRRGQDYDLWLRMSANRSKLRRVATPMIGYRFSRTQISGSTDYLALMTAQPELQSSYWANLNLVLGSRIAARLDAHADPAAIRDAVHQLARSFRPATRARYRRVLNRATVPALPHPDQRHPRRAVPT
ncbi:glycosyltransferase family 2 protein [Austwickia chelonae]|uniref:glycosyltransferase family 2 protein n=1 Tax=Austwickia chelonae TaxID=100225 RepID=UPI0013C35BCD|nr:glycosyltransferase [Austwickia chelonae]